MCEVYRDNCPDCGVEFGEKHRQNCDIERCTVCGNQRLECEICETCKEHNKDKARWSGFSPYDDLYGNYYSLLKIVKQ